MAKNPASFVRFFLAACLFVGIPCVVYGQQPAREILTLDQAITLALRDNRTVKNSELAVTKVDDRLAATRTLRLPQFNVYALGAQSLAQLNFQFDRGVFGTYPGIGPIPGQNTSLSTPLRPIFFLAGSITQPLSQQHRIRLNLDQIKLSKLVAAEELRKQKHDVINDVTQLYFGILLSESALKSLDQSIALYHELDRVTGEYVEQQVALKAQNLEVKTRLAKSEYERLNVSNQLAAQKEQLNNMLARDIRTEFEVAAVIEPSDLEADLSSAQSRALAQRPEIKEARLKVKQADLDRRIKKSEFIPDISLGLNYISPRNFDSFVPKNLANVGLVVTWDVFDWGKKNREIAEKLKTTQQAEIGVQEAESRVLIDVNSKFRKLQQTRQLFRVTRLAQETARENLRVAQNKYKLEAALLSDVLQLQAAVAEADHQYQQAVLGFWTAKADFEKAVGGDQ
jgi:outer membrane protein TolC